MEIILVPTLEYGNERRDANNMIKSTDIHSMIPRSHSLRGNAYPSTPAFCNVGASTSAFPRRSMGTRDTYALGFTLIELLITLGVIAIIMGIAVPSFQSIITNNRLTTQANSMVGALTIARSEAAKRNKVVTVRKNAGGWALGWHVFVDNNRDGSFTAGTDEDIQQYSEVMGNTIKASVNYISYEPSGRSNVNTSFYFCAPSALATFRRVVIHNSGRIRTETESTSSMTYAGKC